jgi:hypothetical protein
MPEDPISNHLIFNSDDTTNSWTEEERLSALADCKRRIKIKEDEDLRLSSLYQATKAGLNNKKIFEMFRVQSINYISAWFNSPKWLIKQILISEGAYIETSRQRQIRLAIRNSDISDLRNIKKMTYKKISEIHALSENRVRQIIIRHNRSWEKLWNGDDTPG